MLNNTVAKAIKGAFKTLASQRSKQTWGTQAVMKRLDLLTLTNTLVIVYHSTAPNTVRVKAPADSESQGRAGEPGGMLRNAT